MTREEAIEEACGIVALAFRSLDDYSRPSDGFCGKCEKLHGGTWNYQNAGVALAFVRVAVVDALKRKGIKIAEGFDPQTGKEKAQ